MTTPKYSHVYNSVLFYLTTLNWVNDMKFVLRNLKQMIFSNGIKCVLYVPGNIRPPFILAHFAFVVIMQIYNWANIQNNF